MNKSRLRWIVITAFGLLAFVGTQVYFNQKAHQEKRAKQEQERRELPPKMAAILAAKLNEHTPRMVDEITRLDEAVVGSGARVITRLTLISHSRSELDKASLIEMRQSVIEQLCKGDARGALNQGVTLQQEYRDRDGKTALIIITDNKACLLPAKTGYTLDLSY